jgi:hypothetical protein
VYGVITRGIDEKNLVFIPEAEAKRLAAIYDAIYTSKTWGDFVRQMPPDDLQDVLARFSDYDIDPPKKEDKFTDDFLPPAYFDGDWPDWAQQKMFQWVPSSIIEKYGTAMPTTINGSYLILDPARKAEIVAEMQAAGFDCMEDEELVNGACGS